jgi:tRNA(Ile)-lysidine synthase
MLSKFEKKVAAFVEANSLFDSADKVLLAVSGGADSVALMQAMWRLVSENVLDVRLCCAHINHQLRGTEADSDEQFVVAQAGKFNLPLTVRRVDVRKFARDNKLSIETAARKLRIDSLLDIARTKKCSCVATGHQKSDNAETVLHRLLRGTGFRGLGGIWPMREFEDSTRFVRPLLCVTREEIVEYLQQRNVGWRVDHTNADCTYTRNYIRHRLLPVLQRECKGSVVQRLSELAQSARKLYTLVRSRAEAVWPELAPKGRADSTDDEVALTLDGFVAESLPVRVELVRTALTAIGSGERDLSHRHYESILQLAERKVGGGRVQLPGRYVVRREYGKDPASGEPKLIFARPAPSGDWLLPEMQNSKLKNQNLSDDSQDCGVPAGRPALFRISHFPFCTSFGPYLIRATFVEQKAEHRRQKIEVAHATDRFIEWFDLDELKPPIVVRCRQQGDRFWPLGSSGQKKVGKFLTGAKVPQRVRRSVLIVADSEKVIWVWPIRMSEQAKVTDDTRKVLQLQISNG